VSISSPARTCPNCGSQLSGATQLCPVCMFRQALAGAGESENSFLEEGLEPPSDSGAQRFDQYELVRGEDGRPIELGRGAMGVTYRAFDVDLQCYVTLKLINERYLGDETARLRFLREARAAASVRHPNVASVFHLGRKRDTYFYAMEYVEGETLQHLIQRSGRLDVKLALQIVTQVAAGLAAIHKKNLVHRDIKPSNIIVNLEEGEALTAKIIDLGLAKAPNQAPSEAVTSTPGAFAGTPEFASPEQFAGIGVDTRSDLYSLGVTLWEMLTGQAPFRGSAAEVIRQHQHASLPREQLKRVPQPVVILLRTLLEKDPARRFQEPAQLLLAIPTVLRAIDRGSHLSDRQLLQIVSSRNHGLLHRVVTAVAASKLRFILLVIAGLLIVTAAVFVGNIMLSSHLSPSQTSVPPLARSLRAPERSIAVLPFESLSDSKSDIYFADGVQDEILSNLAKISQLTVISRTSVMKYRPGGDRDLRSIANTLGVAHVVEGTVRRSGNRCRITTALIDALTEATLWSESYDRDLTDIFAIQSEIAQTVASKLRARLSPEERRGIEERPTDNLEAYDLYLQGKNSLAAATSGDLPWEGLVLSAIKSLEGATRKDPKFALAYCQLAEAQLALHWDQPHGSQRRAFAETAVNEALRLRPDLPEIHLAAARYFYYGWRDYDRVRVHLAFAERARPNNPGALCLAGLISQRQGDWEGAMRSLQKAVALDPRNFEFLIQLANHHWWRRQYQACDQIFDRMIELYPNKPFIRMEKAWIAVHRAADLTEVQTALALYPDSSDDVDIVSLRIYTAILARDWPRVREILRRTSNERVRFGHFPNNFPGFVPRKAVEIVVKLYTGERPTSDAGFAEARDELSRLVEADPKDCSAAGVLGIIDAALRQKEAAIENAKRAVARLPVSRDAVTGPDFVMDLATVYAWTNEPDLALQELTTSARTPGGVTYGFLKLDPRWDPLRTDPRFEQLVAELAPPE
jgi:serine/threonine protein kinase/tetratricopeptide (TPR) repeat protein